MKRIAIYGIGGLYNFGCEAILRGTVKFIRKTHDNNISITYYSKSPNFDYEIVKNLGINIYDISRNMTLLKRLISKLYDILQIPRIPFFSQEFNTIIENSDEIYSIGGDIYTIPKYLRNLNKYRYVNYLVEFGEKAIKAGKHITIFGASIGPFGNYKKAVNYYCSHLKKINKIFCREKESVKYLESIGIKRNIELLPDPAFLVKDNNTKVSSDIGKKYLGINLSELSLQELYGKVSNDDINKISNYLTGISYITKLPLMLIPHVLSPYSTMDNDYMFLKKIKNAIQEKNKNAVILAQTHNFIDTKKYLNQCKMVIAARMHCAINSVIEGIPTIFLSYSQKSRGVAEYIYGDSKYCVSIPNMYDTLLPTINDLLKNRKNVERIIKIRNNEISEIYNNYFKKYTF